MSSSIPMPKISPPQLSSLRRVPKPIFKQNAPLSPPLARSPASVGKKFVDTKPKQTLPKTNTGASFLERNMVPIAIGVLGVSYLVLRKK